MNTNIEKIKNSKLFDDNDKKFINEIFKLGCNAREKWGHKCFKPIYDKAKDKLVKTQERYCFYCQKQYLDIDYDDWHIDHIVPIDEDDRFVFTEENLILSCKWCNRRKNDKPVLVNKPKSNLYSLSSLNYRIIHPRLDEYKENINIFAGALYVGKTSKGRRTIYDCVLDRFELNFITNLNSNDRDFIEGALEYIRNNGKDKFIKFIKSL